MVLYSELTSAHALMDLPSEILGAVCSHLSRTACYQLMKVSHRFKAIAEPLLYTNIQLQVWDHVYKDSFHPFDKLLGNIRERPQLGFYVSALTLRVPVWKLSRYDDLLQRLPNIRYLELSPPFNDLIPWHLRKLECLRLNYYLPSDHYQRQNISKDQRISGVEIMARHLWMPKLRRLEVNLLDLTADSGSDLFLARVQKTAVHEQQIQGENSSKRQLLGCRPGNHDRDSSITTLRLTNCRDMHLGGLPDMLQSLKGLENFTFTINCEWECEQNRTPGISPQAIGRSLEPHLDTLVELIIAGNNAAWFLDTSLFGTLARYRSLKRLAIPEPFLVPSYTSTLHQYLPSQLEDLQLQYPMGFEPGLDNQRKIRHTRMQNLASDKHHSLPELKRIIWWYQQAECWSEAQGRPTRYGGSEGLTEMVGLFEDVGVHFEWLSTPYLYETPFGAPEFGDVWWLAR